MTILIIDCEGSNPTRVELPPGAYSLGGGSSNAIVIDHPTVSERHCDLEIQPDGQVLLRDAGSTNGTRVNSEPVSQATIEPGQSFQVGAARIKVDHVLDRPCSSSLPESIFPTSNTRPSTQPPASSSVPARSFPSELPGAMVYPFRGDAYLYIVAVAGLGLAQAFLPILWGYFTWIIDIVIACHLLLVWRDVVHTTIEGQDQLPDLLQLSLDWEENLRLYLRFVLLIWICFSPAWIYSYAMIWNNILPGWPLYLCYGFGCFYAPMALLAFILVDSLAVLSPFFVLRSIFRQLPDYLFLAGFFGLLAASIRFSTFQVAPGIQAGQPVYFRILSILAGVAGGAMGLYLIFVWMRLLGLFYRRHKESLAWVV